MTGNRGWLRIRALVSSWFTVLAVVCLVLAIVGGWAVYTVHASPGSVVEQRQETHWAVDGEFRHSADVTRENPAFETGETLRNRSTYFIGASPTLDGRYVAAYSGADDDSASVTLDATLVIRATDGETVFWENRTSLTEPTTSSLDAGDTAAVSFSLNASTAAERRAAIQNALGGSPGDVETYVAVDVAVEGTADGQPATLSFTHRLPVTIDDNAYTVGPASAGSERLTTVERTTVTREYGLLWSAGGPILLSVGLAGLTILGAARRRGALVLSPEERELLAYREERAEFDEWVVRIRLTDELRDRPRAEAESLSDLVDFAIDSDTGVIEDPDTGVLAVVTDEFLAVYEPPPGARDASIGKASERGFDPEIAVDTETSPADTDGAGDAEPEESETSAVE